MSLARATDDLVLKERYEDLAVDFARNAGRREQDLPPGDFAIQILLPAALSAQLIPGAEAEPDSSLWKFASRGRPFPLS